MTKAVLHSPRTGVEVGVKEYFIVDPQTKDVTGCYLQNKKFTEEKAKDKIISKLVKKNIPFLKPQPLIFLIFYPFHIAQSYLSTTHTNF